MLHKIWLNENCQFAFTQWTIKKIDDGSKQSPMIMVGDKCGNNKSPLAETPLGFFGPIN